MINRKTVSHLKLVDRPLHDNLHIETTPIYLSKNHNSSRCSNSSSNSSKMRATGVHSHIFRGCRGLIRRHQGANLALVVAMVIRSVFSSRIEINY